MKGVAAWAAAVTMTAAIALISAGVAHGGIAARDGGPSEPSSLIEDYNYPDRDAILAHKEGYSGSRIEVQSDYR
ncbi:hypothetical protein [Amycolatopsis sulphurea]|uniref:hypothetical protein n=1 Tax=Amycolatopsis sulphurea TaxID=76022 RepID=UPI0011457FEC